MLTGLDWFFLVGYLLIICGIGIFFSRRNKNFSQYMFGGHQMPWFAIGISLIATSVSATTFLGNPADAYQTNMTYLMLNIGVFIAILVVAVVFIPRFRALKVNSAYEILELRFSRPVRLLASSFYTLHLLLRTGVLIYGPSLVLSTIFGIDIYLAIFLTAVLAITYTWFGGLQAVVWTDVLQFVVLISGGLITLIFITRGLGSFSELYELASASGKTTWFSLDWDPANARSLLSAGLVYAVFEIAIRGCDQQFVQRYMACRDTRAANLSSLLSAVLGLLVGLIFYWVGAALYVWYQVKGVQPLPEGLGVNNVFPHFILEALPSGLTGLLVAAIFAAAMSSLDSAISALSNTTVQDFFRGERADKALLGQARLWVLIWGAAGTFAAFVCVAGQQSLLSKALFFTSLFIGPLLGLFLFAFFRPSTGPRALFYGALMGMVCLLLFSKIPVLPEGLWSPIYPVSWPWNPLIALGGTTLFSLIFDQIPGKGPSPAGLKQPLGD